MPERKHTTPVCEQLESRIAMSHVAVQPLAHHVHHHPPMPVERRSDPPVIKPADIATGISASNPTPPIGTMDTFTLTTKPDPGIVISATEWSYTIKYNSVMTGETVIPQSTTTQAFLYLPIPGFYEVTAVTTYASTNPTVKPPGPTTFMTDVVVRPPSALTKGAGVGSPVPFRQAAQVSLNITTPVGPPGPYMGGLFEQNIVHYSGIVQDLPKGWNPSQYNSDWYVTSGTLYDTIALDISTPTFNLLPVGYEIGRYTQELDYTWKMVDGYGVVHTFLVGIPSLEWTESKSSASDWEVK